MCNEKESADTEANDRTTDFDIMKAMAVGCSQNHQPSIESARRVLAGLSQAPPETLAEVLEVLLDGGCFTDEAIDAGNAEMESVRNLTNAELQA